MSADSLRDRFERGLSSPICLTWELTYACNLACTHCLSSSGRRDPRELSTSEAKSLIDEIAAMQIFYINIGGGEPMIRRDFFELIEHAVAQRVGVKFSTNGTRIDEAAARRLAGIDYLDAQISIDGVDAATSDRVRGAGSYVQPARETGYLHVVAESRARGERVRGTRLARQRMVGWTTRLCCGCLGPLLRAERALGGHGG